MVQTSQASIEELLKRSRSIYKLIVVAAKRAKELAEGAPKFVEMDSKKATTIALEEIRQGKILCEPEEAEGAKKRERPSARGERREAKKRTAKAGEKKKS